MTVFKLALAGILGTAAYLWAFDPEEARHLAASIDLAPPPPAKAAQCSVKVAAKARPPRVRAARRVFPPQMAKKARPAKLLVTALAMPDAPKNRHIQQVFAQSFDDRLGHQVTLHETAGLIRAERVRPQPAKHFILKKRVVLKRRVALKNAAHQKQPASPSRKARIDETATSILQVLNSAPLVTASVPVTVPEKPPALPVASPFRNAVKLKLRKTRAERPRRRLIKRRSAAKTAALTSSPPRTEAANRRNTARRSSKLPLSAKPVSAKSVSAKSVSAKSVSAKSVSAKSVPAKAASKKKPLRRKKTKLARAKKRATSPTKSQIKAKARKPRRRTRKYCFEEVFGYCY